MEDYGEFLELLIAKNGKTSIEDREIFASRSFNISSHYDSAIFNYFNRNINQPVLKISETQANVLRYGENLTKRFFLWRL